MATRSRYVNRYQGPCGQCDYKSDCNSFRELDQYLFRRPDFQRVSELTAMDVALAQVVQAFILALRQLHTDGRLLSENIGPALSALVDFCITGVYTNGLLGDDTQFAQRAIKCVHGLAVFPYTWMCPLCVAAGAAPTDCYLPDFIRRPANGTVRDYPKVEMLAKPGGRAIGDQGIQVIKALLREVLKNSLGGAKLRDGGGARGEFDLTIATDSLIAFIEVKAKPLISYPLVVKQPDESTTHSNKHEWVSVAINDHSSLSLFLAAIDHHLPIANPTADTVSTWPLGDLALACSNPDVVALVVKNWALQAKAYEEQWGNEPDRLRWHRFGCGNFHTTEEDGTRVEKRVANTKELPGLDRTDDIKKGAAQVLKYSRLKFDCKKRALRAVLLGNTHALTHHDDYVAPILHLKVLKDGDDASQAEWIFDAIVGLTRNHFNMADLEDIFAFEQLISEGRESA